LSAENAAIFADYIILATTLARQMGAQKWGICRTSSITEVVMQMKYTIGKEKTPQ